MPTAGTRRANNVQVLAGLGGAALALLSGVAILALFLAFVSPRNPGGIFNLGWAHKFTVSEPVYHVDGEFWLVRQEDGSFLAFSEKIPWRNCPVQWLDDFGFDDPATGEWKVGWFREPCYHITYHLDGRCAFGPCYRGLDRFPTHVKDGLVSVDTSSLIPGQVRQGWR
jgi:nitrite reductase/ring-hydroxylating ferredoxin subunit